MKEHYHLHKSFTFLIDMCAEPSLPWHVLGFGRIFQNLLRFVQVSLQIYCRPATLSFLARPDLAMQALVDKLKSIDSSMTLVTTKQGFLYTQVSAPGIQLASEVRNLEVVPHDALHPAQEE